MLIMKNKNCLLYYKVLKTLFSTTSFKESKFLIDVKKQLIEFSLQHPNCTYDDVIDFFGKPEDVFSNYINSFGSMNLYQKMRKKKTIQITISVIVILVLTIWIIFFSFWLKSYYDFSNSLPTTNETNINKGDLTE